MTKWLVKWLPGGDAEVRVPAGVHGDRVAELLDAYPGLELLPRERWLVPAQRREQLAGVLLDLADLGHAGSARTMRKIADRLEWPSSPGD